MLLLWGEFLGLLLIISIAAYILSVQSEKIAKNVGANFTGSVILGLITTLPEYLFVIYACIKLKYDVAIGSTVGAAAMLVTLGYGLVIIVGTTRLSKKPVKLIELSQATRVDSFYLNFTALLALLLAWLGHGLSIIDGIILIACFGVYVYHSYSASRKVVKEKKSHGEEIEKIRAKTILFLLLGAAIIVAAAEPFVDSMIEVAHSIGISPVAIAIILSPIASEMPEKLTAFITVRRDGKLAEISICNFIGSKINHNSLLIGMLPVIAIITGYNKGFVPDVLTAPFIMMTVLTVFAALSLSRRKLCKWQGFLFLSLFLVVIGMAYYSR